MILALALTIRWAGVPVLLGTLITEAHLRSVVRSSVVRPRTIILRRLPIILLAYHLFSTCSPLQVLGHPPTKLAMALRTVPQLIPLQQP